MNARRAQDLLRHITQDEDNGAGIMDRISVGESIEVVTQLLPDCIKAADEKNNVNDSGYFNAVLKKYRPIVIEKIKNTEQLWIVYCETTGYPYMVDKDIVILYDYTNHTQVEKQLEDIGFTAHFEKVDAELFKTEIAHMYRNGYKNIRFINGKGQPPFVVAREEFFDYSEFFNDEYMTNPGLQQTMINFFQEFRKQGKVEPRKDVLKTREDAMLVAMSNAEYMVPCIKEETDEQIEISHPFIDLTDKIKDKKEGEKIIAVPVFTDGFEMDKCYEGHHENMLYKFSELKELINELGASGIIINCLGISYYMKADIMKRIG